MCLNGTWGTVCSDRFDTNDARVVCRQLGYSPYGIYTHCIESLIYVLLIGALTKGDIYSETVLSHNIYNINCTGNEEFLMNCTYNTKPSNGSTCESNDDAIVICQGIFA